jgi:hypothetical protein
MWDQSKNRLASPMSKMRFNQCMRCLAIFAFCMKNFIKALAHKEAYNAIAGILRQRASLPKDEDYRLLEGFSGAAEQSAETPPSTVWDRLNSPLVSLVAVLSPGACSRRPLHSKSGPERSPDFRCGEFQPPAHYRQGRAASIKIESKSCDCPKNLFERNQHFVLVLSMSLGSKTALMPRSLYGHSGMQLGFSRRFDWLGGRAAKTDLRGRRLYAFGETTVIQLDGTQTEKFTAFLNISPPGRRVSK